MALSDGVIVAYHFNSGALETDSSPNNLTLTNTNSVTTVTGKLAEAADFERSSSQRLSRADNALFEVTSLSVSFWMKVESFNDYGMVVCRWNEVGNNRAWGVATFADGKVYAYNSSDGSAASSINNGSALSTATWYHVVVTYDETDTTTGKKIYIDGTNVASGSVAALPTTGSAALYIGDAEFFAGWTAYFDGAVDELVIWDRVLNSTEVSQLYNSGNGIAYPFASSGSVKTVNGLAFASVKTVNGLAIASVKTINGAATA